MLKTAAITVVAIVIWVTIPGAAVAASGETILCKRSNYGCVSGSGYTGQSVWGSWGPGHNCVSYAAYRLSQNGAAKPWTGSIGDGSQWDEKARAAGVTVDTTPVVGSIAQWDGASGHVAYVETVAAGYIEISEDAYLSDTSGYTAVRRLDRNGTIFAAAEFIHVPGGGPTHRDDYAIYRPVGGTGYWYAKAGPSGTSDIQAAWGIPHGGWAQDIPVTGDVNGDNYDDYGIYRMEGSTGTWYFKSSTDGQPTAIWGSTHGSPGDIPVVGDFNGDNIDDFGIYRLVNGAGTWYFKSSANGLPTPIWGAIHGSAGDIPITGDFNGDNIDDFGIYRMGADSTGRWYVKSGADGQNTPIWGAVAGSPGDVPVVGDFNSDGIDDFGIYRSIGGTGYWYFKSGSDGQPISTAWGIAHGGWAQDRPLAGNFG